MSELPIDVNKSHAASIPVPVQRDSINAGIVRLLLLALSLISTAFLVYASLVPLHYQPLPVAETIAKFWATPWFALSIERRADWVANGLILLPSGFFAAGAVDWRRRSRLALAFASPLIVAALIAVVLAIEFVQIWFPPRVVSQNDIFAGVVGSLGGVVLWWLVGRKCMNDVEAFAAGKPGLQRWVALVNFAMLGICLFNLMPLDLVLNWQEWNAKISAGRIILMPFSDFHLAFKNAIFFTYATFRVVPYVLFATQHLPVRLAVRRGLLWAVLFELVKVPIFSRTASATNVVGGMLGVALAVGCAARFWPVVRKLDRSLCWFLAALGWSLVMLVGFLSRFEQVVRDPELIKQRFYGIVVVPFARAHSSSEFEAGENIVLKFLVFALLSFLLFGWCSRLRAGTAALARLAAGGWIVLLAIAIEVGQVFLFPLVPDATDFILYGAGAWIGVIALRMLIPVPRSG